MYLSLVSQQQEIICPFMDIVLIRRPGCLNLLKSQAPSVLKAYSNYVTTVPVLTYALTDKNQYNSVSMAQAYSLIEVAAAAGFDTYWISNQERYGILIHL